MSSKMDKTSVSSNGKDSEASGGRDSRFEPSYAMNVGSNPTILF